MKPNKIVIFVLLALTLFSCDKGFEEMNKSEDLVTEPTLDYMIPTIQLTLFERSYYTHYTMIARLTQQMHMSNVESGRSRSTTMCYLFEYQYSNVIKNVVDVIEKTKNDPNLVNYHSMASIMYAYEISRLTDAYGDVPYSEAGLGYTHQIYYPKYEPQQEIYQGIINQVKTAIANFDTSKKMVPASSDIVFQGDVNKWKRFGHSLLLRFGMKISKADPALAEATVKEAFSGGVMSANDDSFVVFYKPDTYYSTTANGNAAANKYDYKCTDAFIDLLKNSNDPRLSVYVMLPNGNTDPAVQRGFTLFQSDNTSKKIVSTPNTKTYAAFHSPYVHMSYAETLLLLSEAVINGWITGDAEKYFLNGIRANLEFQSIYGEDGVIPESEIDTYINSLNFDPNNKADARKQLYTQMWIMFYFNWNEAFATWRRTGVPNFNDEYSSKISRRLLYPQSEWNTNGDNVREAVARQGDDDVMTRVWWDKK
jgi:hypothetical protein